MKFHCPSCKAAYQLPDERVAGKILQIKCRRCASLIEVVGDPGLAVSPAAKPGGVPPAPPSASGLPTAAPDGADDDEETAIMKLPPRGLVPLRAAASPRAAPAGTAPPAKTPQAPPVRGPLTGLGRMAFPARVAPSAAAGPPRPASAALPRPSPSTKGAAAGGPAAAPHPAAPVEDATLPSPGADKLPLPAAPVAAASSHPPPSPSGAPVPSKPLFPPGGGSLGAVGKAATAPPARPVPTASVLGARTKPLASANRTLLGLAAPPRELAAMPTPAATPGVVSPPAGPAAKSSKAAPAQWFIEIGGSRIGPIDRDAIRGKLLSGLATGDSLLWREGSADRQHLKNMPEFAEWLREAELRHAPPDPGPPPLAASPPSAAVALFAPASAGSTAAQRPAPAPPAGTGVPLEVMSDPFATPPPQPIAPPAGAATGAAEPALPSHEAKANGFPRAAAEISLPADQPPPSAGEPLSMAPRKRAGMPFMAYVFIALAAGFGGVGAYVLLTRKPPPAPGQPQIVYVPAPAAPGAASPANAPAEAAPGTPAGTEGTDTQNATKTGTKAGPLRSADPKAGTPAGPSAPLDMSGFGTSGVAGPSAEGPSTSAQGSGGKLSEGEMNGVVAQNKPIVSRRCWQPAFDARSRTGGSTSARVVASLIIGPAGNVLQVSASGAEKEFPGLANCIAARVKTWKFPASGGTTSANVPFVFAAQ